MNPNMPMFNPSAIMNPYGNINANMDWRNLYNLNQNYNPNQYKNLQGDKYQPQSFQNPSYQYNYPNYPDPSTYSQYQAYYNQYMNNQTQPPTNNSTYNSSNNY